MKKSLSRLVSGNILVFALTDSLGNFARSMVFPYASLYILALGGNAAQIGLVTFLGQLAGLVLLPIAGHITDHSNRIHLIVLSGFLSSLFLAMIVLAPTWQIVALASLLFGIVVFQFPAYSSLIADSLSLLNRGREIGILNTISSLLSIFAPYLAGMVIERYNANQGMRILYTTQLVIYLTGTFFQMKFLRETSPVERQALKFSAMWTAFNRAFQSIPALIRQMSTPLKALALVVVLSFMTNGVVASFWVVYATDHIGFSASKWGLILLIEAVVRLALFLPAGLLVDRWGRTTSLIIALLIYTLSTPLFILQHSFIAITLARIAIAVAYVLAIPACTALMVDLVPRAMRGQVMAAIGQGGIMLGPAGGGTGGPAIGYLIIPPLMIASLAGGYLYTINPIYPWIFSTVAGLISILLTLFFIRDPRQAEQ